MINNISNEIQHLKEQSENADTYEPLKQLFADRRRLMQERAHLVQLELHNESEFSLLTSAKV